MSTRSLSLPKAPLLLGIAGAALLGATAYVTHRRTWEARRQNPPTGRFIDGEGVELHYTEHGDPGRPPLVLLHGNGAMVQEMELSGLVEQAAQTFRVLVFDRPGYGHSARPAGRSYAPMAQAAMVLAALHRLGVDKPLVLGHSWGSMVAMSMALREPDYVRALVLASGYYTPSLRLDTAFMSVPAIPLLGTLMRHTLSPVVARLLWPLTLRRLFGPAPVPQRFRDGYPVWMALRPSQLEAGAAESAMMQWQCFKLRRREAELSVPTVIIAGENDRMVRTRWQAERLHRRLPTTRLNVVPGVGHMVHHNATDNVMQAIRRAWRMATPATPIAAKADPLRTAPFAAVQPDPVQTH
jgi:pimeloyl-ACP methyl ester carboxylesterase